MFWLTNKNYNFQIHTLVWKSKIHRRSNIHAYFLSHDVTSGSDITPGNKVYKPQVVYRLYCLALYHSQTLRHVLLMPLVVYRFSENVDVHNNVAYIMTK